MADTVLFDVDGTLVDSNYWHVVAWQQAFARNGVWQPGWRLHECIGMGGDRLVAAVAGDEVEERLGDRVREAWREVYDATLPQVKAFPGAGDLLREVKRRGFRVVLASSGKPDHVEHARGLLNADDAIDAVTTSEDAESSKPAGDIFAVALKAGGGTTAVVVGDSPWDVEAGKAVDAAVVALATGGFPTGWLRESGAVSVHDDPAALLTSLDDVAPLARPS